MPNLFGTDIAGTIATAFSGQLLTGTLIKVETGTRTPGSLTGGVNSTETNYTFEGFIEQKKEVRMGGTLITTGGEVVSILGGSLSTGIEPEANDKVTIEGTTYRITEIFGRDPAGALFECLVEV